MHIHESGVSRMPVSPNLVEQHLAREDLPWTACEAGEQIEFERRERDDLVSATDHVAGDVDFQITDREVLDERLRCRTQTCAESGNEFLRLERLVLADLAQEKDLVLSTGGGIVLKPENREVLRNDGFVVYLNARPELLAERTKHDRTRPLLNVEDPLTRLRELFAVRDPLYREVAHAVVETGRGAPQQVVQAILGEISRIDR